MASIFMKEFSSIATTSGTQKISKIKKEKNKGPYHPAQDFYKIIRESIIDALKKDLGIEHILKTADEYDNEKRKPAYKLIAKNYKKWMGKKEVSWINPPRGKYEFSSSTIILNPELGFNYDDDVTRVIKLYFAEEKVSQNRANYMIYLMNEVLPKKHSYHVLDIRRKRLFNATNNHDTMFISINSEITGIESAWELL